MTKTFGMNILGLNALLNPQEHVSHDFDISKVDFRWVEKTTNKRELMCAYYALKVDDRYPDLLSAVTAKL